MFEGSLGSSGNASLYGDSTSPGKEGPAAQGVFPAAQGVFVNPSSPREVFVNIPEEAAQVVYVKDSLLQRDLNALSVTIPEMVAVEKYTRYMEELQLVSKREEVEGYVSRGVDTSGHSIEKNSTERELFPFISEEEKLRQSTICARIGEVRIGDALFADFLGTRYQTEHIECIGENLLKIVEKGREVSSLQLSPL